MRRVFLLTTLLIPATASAGPPGGVDSLSPFALRQGPARVSDWLGGTTIGGAVLGVGGGTLVMGGDWRPLGATSGAVVLTVGLTGLTKVLSSRRRPYTWDSGHPGARVQGYCRSAPPAHPDDCRSFFSGHTALSAASSFSAVRGMELGGGLGTPQARLLAYSSATALTVAIGSLRVAAGKHYVSDVVVGAAVGTGIGLLVPGLLQN